MMDDKTLIMQSVSKYFTTNVGSDKICQSQVVREKHKTIY